MTDSLISAFSRLFKGNARSVGRWDPSRPRGKQSYTDSNQAGFEPGVIMEFFEEHLRGGIGIGIVPIRDDGMTLWGAIDIDNHGSDSDIDIRAIEKKVHAAGLPLVPCRSKSGGVHLYAFFSEPVRADIVKNVLTRWSKELDVEGVDCIYPKQGRLSINSEGVRALGNWINLPYHGGLAGPDSPRFAVSNGKRMSLESFVLHAEARALDTAALQRIVIDDTSEMPPCLRERLKSGGFSPGERNDGVYQVAIYCKKRDPESARDMAHDMALKFMPDNPIGFKERDKTIRSATGSRSSTYRCSVFSDVCDREACRKLKHGISEGEYVAALSRAAMPAFHSLVKYHNADPVRFDLSVGELDDARRIEGLTINELANFVDFRKTVMERTHIVLPRLKGEEWDSILKGLFDEVRIEEVPEDSTPEGIVWVRLVEFLKKADLKSEGDATRDREALLRGVPVVQLFNDERVVMFRHVDFVAYLIRTRTDAIKNKDLWFKANRNMGVQNTRVRVGPAVVSVWYVPASAIVESEHHAVDFTPEY